LGHSGMNGFLARAWEELVLPMLRRPRSRQVAALCWREGGDTGSREVLVITSRDTGRWVIPKGWPIEGLTGSETALTEAWEEAGVKAEIAEDPVGNYAYDKGLDGGLGLPTRVDVYAARVTSLADDWPERAERTREWVTPAEAALRVAEPELKAVLQAFGKR
jgi:8-oxo-dGTP pyrophosphatase MutT (NUDIX family)